MSDSPIDRSALVGPRGDGLKAETPQLSEAKRALLEKYLRGELPQAAGDGAASARHAGAGPDVDTEESDTRERVVTIQAGGRQRPFFFLHGQWELGGFFCFPLAQALGQDRPFYALEPYRFDGLPVPPSMEAIAAAHLKSLRAVQPQGPYLLAGWCNGGLLAYEMARQLDGEGQQVDLLVLMDPVYLVYPRRLRWIRAVIARMGNLTRFPQNKQLKLYLSLRQAYRRMGHIHSYLRDADYRRTADFFGFGREDYPGIYDWSAMEYKPGTLYPGKLTFFWSITQPFRGGWRLVEVAREVEVHVMPCSHTNCFDSYLEQLAQRLRSCILGIQAVKEAGARSEHLTLPYKP